MKNILKKIEVKQKYKDIKIVTKHGKVVVMNLFNRTDSLIGVSLKNNKKYLKIKVEKKKSIVHLSIPRRGNVIKNMQVTF
uniref:Uncharacterized protein n=1 Tax=Cavenderia fasciculata TaxID=261658 RepID=B2XX66_CACFS|nr:hypothetical protein Difao_mp04 [Cavenderia fasciculata]ABX45188.1 hypothetical protein [Cavenderia fasciculata]